MAPELHENHGKITLDTIRRLYHRNVRRTLYKLVQKIHPAIPTGSIITIFIDIIGVSSYFLIAGSLLPV